MASPARLRAQPGLTKAALETLHLGAARNALPLLVLTGLPECSSLGSCLAQLVLVRNDGFMVIVPVDDQISENLDELVPNFPEAGEDEIKLLHQSLVSASFGRGGATIVDCAVMYLDVGWPAAACFRRAPGRTVAGFIPFATATGDACKPRKDSVLAGAQLWISESMDEETAEAYLTAASGEGAAADDEQSQGGALAEAATTGLQRRVLELEAQLQAQSQQQAGSTGARGVGGNAPPAPQLFGDEAQRVGITPAQLAQLHQLLGAPPARLAEPRRAPAAGGGRGTLQRGPVLQAPHLAQQATHFRGLETDLEASLDDDIAAFAEEGGVLQPPPPPVAMQDLMMLQMQQQTALLNALLQNQQSPSDPLTKILGGSSGDSSSGGGARGCAARDVLLRSYREHPEAVIATVRAHAAEELGVEPQSLLPSGMKEFFEKKVPMANQKLLFHMAYLFAEMWQLSETGTPAQLQSMIARSLVFCEQVALDNGGTQFAWLLTGLPDPPRASLQSHRGGGVKPFSRLGDARW